MKKSTMGNNDVVISAGHKNFHLLFSAAEMAIRGRLSRVLTGIYPTPVERRIARLPGLREVRKLERFLNREERFSDERVCQSRYSELVSGLGLLLRRRFPGNNLDDKLQSTAFRMYGRKAIRHLRQAAEEGAKIYHYRAGYGQSSVQVARDLGMRTICDHSLVHPALLQILIDNGGRFPQNRPAQPTGFWADVLADIEQADLILVNSDFVAKSCRFMGFDPDRIVVAYQGVENKFIARLPETRTFLDDTAGSRPQFLFAGSMGPRKGLDVLQKALARLSDAEFDLHMAGGMSVDARARYAGLLADPRVTYHGLLSPAQIAQRMSESDLFVFPTLAEGSARVVFEAMAAGCAVITTENAGSIVSDEVSGWLIPPGEADALCFAITAALSNPERLSAIGRANQTLIREQYNQSAYGNALEKTYGL